MSIETGRRRYRVRSVERVGLRQSKYHHGDRYSCPVSYLTRVVCVEGAYLSSYLHRRGVVDCVTDGTPV